MIHLLELQHGLVPLSKAMKCDNPRRGIKYDAASELNELNEFGNDDKHNNDPKKSMSELMNNDREAEEEEAEGDRTFMTTTGGSSNSSKKKTKKQNNISDGPMPLISPMSCKIHMINTWIGHDDSIICLELVENSNDGDDDAQTKTTGIGNKNTTTLMTSGYDRYVKLWNYSLRQNQCIGVLRRQNTDVKHVTKEWKFNVDVTSFVEEKRRNASNIVEKINRVVDIEHQRRLNGEEDQNPFYDHDDEEDDGDDSSQDTAYEQKRTDSQHASKEEDDVNRNNKKALIGGMTKNEIDIMYESVRMNVSNINDTKKKLISNYSNLTRIERLKLGNNTSLASNIRRTPRMYPVGPQDAGKGLSATPRGRSSRIKKKNTRRK